ncbi:hypothetical protein BCR35DRAFT_334176 [Leucosporidium creatinivorum]|uniref:Uncharacterized protein n=1 Tax=Leucosporidium creatinivorum TaxID=106004 RepID=A0A1Y2EGU9_9BASI|nr:hypothetical protein BCR35DRAFT_334176 [Leucosporidium creatinivorum]
MRAEEIPTPVRKSTENRLVQMTTAPSSSYALAFAVVDSPITALSTKITAHGATPCTHLIHLFSNISTSTPINELTAEIEKAVALWREKESTIEPIRVSPNSPTMTMSSFGAPLAQKVPARPPVLEIPNFADSESQANVFVVALKDDKSLNMLKDLLKAKFKRIDESLSKESVKQFELALRDDGVLESIAGEKEVELKAVVGLKKSEEGWAAVGKVGLAEEEEEDEQDE